MEPLTNQNVDVGEDVVPTKNWQDILATNGLVVSRGNTSPVAVDLTSPNYKSGTTGWKLGSNGGVEFNESNYITLSGTETISNKTIIHKNAAFKSSDETVNNSSTLQNDDDLLVAIGASEIWSFEIDIFFDSGTTPDIKFALSGPSGATGLWSFVEVSSNVTKSIDGSSSASRDGGGAGFVRQTRITGYISNSTNAGNIQLLWAQNTADASDTIVKAGSRFIATRLT